MKNQLNIKEILFFKALLLFLYHIAFLFIYVEFFGQNDDGFLYYSKNLSYEFLLFKYSYLPAFIAKIIGEISYNYYFQSFIFSIISFFGFYKLLVLIDQVRSNSKIYKLLGFFVLLDPTVHLWTSTISKEAIIFPLLIFLISNILKEKKILTIICISLISFVRIHIGIVFLSSLVIIKLFGKDKIMAIFLFSISVGFIALYPEFITNKLNMNVLECMPSQVECIEEYIKKRNHGTFSGSLASSDKEGYLTTLLNRNFLIADQVGNFSIMVIIYAFIPQLLFLSFILRVKFFSSFLNSLTIRRRYLYSKEHFLILFGVLGSLVFYLVTANLGIILRQRYIFITAIFIGITAFLYKRYRINDNALQRNN